jgi:opacity protein-like surface antigen
MTDLKISGTGSTGDTRFAYQALAGAKLFFTKHIAVFAEYKFTSASHSWDVQGTKVDADQQVNHVVGGLAFHF